MSNIKLFEQREIRSYWNEKEEQWYFSVVDIVEALTDSVNATDYLKKLRKCDSELGSYIGTNCPQVEMLTNGKKIKTLAGTAKDIFRIIQSIPSPKAEPFKQWLAKVGYERMQEIQDPEMSLERARENWQKLGRSEKWIQQRMNGQKTIERRLLTTFFTASITISISLLMLNFPIEKRIELNAATSSKPIAVNTWEGSMDAEVQALQLLTAIKGKSVSGLLKPIMTASESAPLKRMFEVLDNREEVFPFTEVPSILSNSVSK